MASRSDTLVFLPAGVAAVIWFQLMRASSSAVVVGGEITILVIALAINQAALIVPLRRRFAAAVERQDADAVDAVLDEAAAMWPRNAKMRAFVDGNRAVALMFRERWDEAVAQARSALAGPLARTQEALLLNNLAWALAHTGALDEAMFMSLRNRAREEDERAHVLDTIIAGRDPRRLHKQEVCATERELELPKQGHIRARLWFASRFGQAHHQ